MKIISGCVQETLRVGKAVAQHAMPQDVVLLFGDLGSGKTVLAKGIAQGLGIDKESIVSPTFVLLNQYLHGRIPLYHFDLYRLTDAQEILGLGYEEYLFGQGMAVVEWADRLGPLQPKEYLKISLAVKGSTQRTIEIEAHGRRYEARRAQLAKDLR